MIYYTTDGTDPTEDSKAIVEGSPLTINGKKSSLGDRIVILCVFVFSMNAI